MRTLKPRNLNLKFQTFKAHNRKYLSYPKLVWDATLYFRTAKRANGMRKFQCQEVKQNARASDSHNWRVALREESSMTCNENFEKLSSAQHAYCIWLCWLLVRKIDIDRLAIFPLHRIDYFPFSKLDYRNKLNTPSAGRWMYDGWDGWTLDACRTCPWI